jgi:hypothetical protein
MLAFTITIANIIVIILIVINIIIIIVFRCVTLRNIANRTVERAHGKNLLMLTATEILHRAGGGGAGALPSAKVHPAAVLVPRSPHLLVMVLVPRMPHLLVMVMVLRSPHLVP